MDRDGTLKELVPYVKDPAFVRLMGGVIDFLKRAQDQGYLLVRVTNQSGLGRMYELLALEGIRLDASFLRATLPRATNWFGRECCLKLLGD